MVDARNHPHPNPLPEGKGTRARIANSTLLLLAGLALFITVLNALKPIEVDDAVFVQNAAQIARHPFDPYGFTVFWFQWPEPAIWELCPPVLPYWIALGMKLLGPAPLLWKLWLLPWVLTLVFALHALFRRFCSAEGALPLTVMTALSPAFLPGINLMFDVPAVTLDLLSLNLLLVAVDDSRRFRWGLATLSGVFAGLAMQTKFTALSLPAVLFTGAALRRRFGLGLIPPLVGSAIFTAWELVDWHRYGVSHFWFNLRANDVLKGTGDPVLLIRALVPLLGGLASAVAGIGLIALGAAGWLIASLIVATLLGFAAVAVAPLSPVVFISLGVIVWSILALVITRLLRSEPGGWGDLDTRFLIFWLGIELLACTFISPFPAARRVISVILVLTVIAGRLAARRAPSLPPTRRAVVWSVVGFSALLGLGFELLDALDAIAQRNLVTASAAVIDPARTAEQTVWFTGHLGVDFYARRRGYLPVVPDQSRVRSGDWILDVRSGVSSQAAGFAASVVTLVKTVTITDADPYRFLPYYYGSGYPLWHSNALPIVANVYQATHDFVPLSTMAPQRIVDWATSRREPLPPDSVPAVLRAAAKVDPAAGRLATDAVAASGTPALLQALRDPAPAARAWAARLLQQQPDAVGNAPVLDALRQRILRDRDPAVRAAAAAALQQLSRPVGAP